MHKLPLTNQISVDYQVIGRSATRIVKGEMQNADNIIRNHNVLGVRKAADTRNQSFLDDSQGDGMAGISATDSDRAVY